MPCITLQITHKSLASSVCALTLKDALTAAAAFHEVSVCIVQLVQLYKPAPQLACRRFQVPRECNDAFGRKGLSLCEQS